MEHKGPVIVAIDDNKDNLVALKAFVADAFPGAGVFSATDGKHGIDLAREKNPDVVLLDILMPGMDGFEVCRQLKADPQLSHIPVVFITALKDDRKSRIRALEVGGEAFISKPFDEAELTAQIRAMVKIKAAGERVRDEKKYLAGLVADRTSQLEWELAERRKAEQELGEANQVLEKNKTAMLNLLDDLKEEIEARKKSEAALKIYHVRLESAMDAGSLAWWEMDCRTRAVAFSEKKAGMLGYSPDRFSQYTDFTALVHPDDLELVMQAMRDHLDGKAPAYDIEYRIRASTGEYRWFHDSGRITGYNSDRTPEKVTGLVVDITGRKLAEETLMRVNQKLNILSELTRKDLTSQIFVLNSYLEMAKKHAAGQDQIIATLQKGDHAIRLIHETVEYSKDYQDMGAKPPTWQNVKMALLLGLSHISMGNIQHSIETEELEIVADPLLEKACQGLFENSMTHGGHVTRIRVWHKDTPDGVTIIFEDDGTGIPHEKKERIFLRNGGDRAAIRGLFFVREILDITGITIKETGEPGKGARFEIVVPKGMWRMAGKGE